MTFGIWPDEAHLTADQQKRLSFAKSAKTTPTSIDRENKTGIFPSSGATPYKTTLKDCTCIDFARRKLPCKHIYRLAIELGLLCENVQTGINKNVLKSSQMTLADAVAEVENLSDDGQLFIKNLPQTERIIFSVAQNDPELTTCSLLSASPLELRVILEQMQKTEILAVLKDHGYAPEKNIQKSALISWTLECIPDIASILPSIVQLSASPFAHKIWRKLNVYLRRKFDWEHSYIESEERGIEEILFPAGAEYTGLFQNERQYFFPDDEITELLNLYGHNRCLNGFIVDKAIESQQQIAGKRFAITGSFDKMTRAEVSALILAHGGKVNEWVTKNTDYLVVGNDAGSKLQRAKDKGVSLLEIKDILVFVSNSLD